MPTLDQLKLFLYKGKRTQKFMWRLEERIGAFVEKLSVNLIYSKF